MMDATNYGSRHYGSRDYGSRDYGALTIKRI
ncbi:MAG: hypothetical protein ACI9B8_002281, partial [Sulfitobacter sp.]